MAYNYAGYWSQSTTAYAGVERFISTPSSRLFSTTQEHILYWMEVVQDRADCLDIGQGASCWVQAGLGMGTVGYGTNVATATYLQAYFENSGPGSFYQVGFYPSIPLSQNTFYNVFWVATEADGHQRFQSDVGTTFLSWGWTWAAGEGIAAAAEMYSDPDPSFGVHCPTIDTAPNASVYFGTTGFGGINTNYGLANSPNGQTWSLWTGAINPPRQNYNFALLQANWAFRARGGGD